MTFTPTDEQRRILDAYATGGSLQIEAGAGTGKTSTLRLVAAANPADRLLYLCYNAVTAKEARAAMPRNVDSVTAHAFALRSLRNTTAPQVQAVLSRLEAARTPNSVIGRHLGIRTALDLGDDRRLQPSAQVALARGTITQWCYSDDPTMTDRHVPDIIGATSEGRAAAVPVILRYAQRLWEDATSPTGQYRTDHDHYLKLYALRGDVWGTYQAVLIDEAQDANGVVVGMLGHQQRNGNRLVLVGDRSQSLYAWRGSVDCMDRFTVDHALRLSQSFRFGPAVAHEANKWLTAIRATLRLSGTPTLPTRIGPVPVPDAVLCRTNAACMEHVLEAHLAGTKVALVGGGVEVRRLAEAAEQLQTTGQTWHPDLAAFSSWGQVQDFVNHDGGGDLKTLVNLVDTYGAGQIMAAIDACVDEPAARLVVSTAHKAKGREWGRVKVGADFPCPTPGEELDRQVGMLAYVTVTRARGHLDRGSLTWIDDYLTTFNLTVGDEKTLAVATEPEPTLDPTPAPDPTPDTDTLPIPATPTPLTARTIKLALPDQVWAMIDEWAAATRQRPAAVLADAITQLHAAAQTHHADHGRPFYQPTHSEVTHA